ncbi:MAG: peptide chain release factor N(5)-glutamine methyltransferase [Thermodesulfobacteriota bacterium]
MQRTSDHTVLSQVQWADRLPADRGTIGPKERSDETKMTILEVLNWSVNYLEDHQIENSRLNAELLLARSLNLSREGLYMRLHDQVEERNKEVLEKLMQRRIAGEPLQYILEHQEFWSLDVRVDPRVLIPRPETELLVEQSLLILRQLRASKRISSVLEIGTGSGAIAIALAKELKDLLLVATDISLEALVLAAENARSAEVLNQINFVNGDLFGPLHSLKDGAAFDLILSNPPYITRGKIDTLAKEVKDHEPRVALDGGEDGLAFYRRIIPEAHFYLQEGGWLLLEVALGQSGIVSGMIDDGGHFLKPESIPDLSGIGRVVKAQKRRE